MRSSPAPEPPVFADVEAAAARLAGVAMLTPLIESQRLNERIGGRLFVKAEALQKTGSFKIRGAYNRLASLAEEGNRGEVVAYSSGNHAQGVAAAAALVGVRATIVMPRDAPASKVRQTRDWGAEIIFYDRATESREALAETLAAERGAVLVRPYDDPWVIAGQGTVGLELASQAEAAGVRLDAGLVPCGGGGLAAGICLALGECSPSTRVHTVEPRGFDDTARSLAEGWRVVNRPGARSFCDALLAPSPGTLTLAILQKAAAAGLSVGDDETQAAIAAAFTHLKLVLEPGGAVALAAALAGAFEAEGGTVAVIASGGNVDADVFCRALAAGRPA